MAVEVTVAVGTFGDLEWIARAARAIASVPRGVPVIHRHRETLAQARNDALAAVRTEWVVHLDADDELEPGYLMTLAAGSADIRAPSVRYVYPEGRVGRPMMPRVGAHGHEVCEAGCLRDGNWIVIGAMVSTELLRFVGGWEDWPMYEDWAAFARMWQAGASVEAIPEAVYRAHVRRDSRNRAPSRDERLAAHRAIEQAIWGEVTV